MSETENAKNQKQLQHDNVRQTHLTRSNSLKEMSVANISAIETAMDKVSGMAEIEPTELSSPVRKKD